VTVFDVDYVVAKTTSTSNGETEEVTALEDRCPHKAAALSEGRLTSTGHFQCAYHGWSFDGTTGICQDIPQIAQVDKSPPFPSRSCAKAVPAQIHQEMVYLFLGGTAEEALLAPPPPSVPEYLEQNFQMSCSIRDMPVDWPIVVSNICDAEHGAFAHQAKAFDMYAASKEHPLHVTQEFPNDGKGWVVKTKVDASDKLLEVDRQRRQLLKDRKGQSDDALSKIQKAVTSSNAPSTDEKKEKESPWATTRFEAPFHLQMRRLDKKTGTTNFVSSFYICPTGVGRCRFMAAGLSKKAPPRWITKLMLDNFLDQDTYLLATQQHYILGNEANDLRDMMKQRQKEAQESSSKGRDPLEMQTMNTRRRLFCMSTPTDAFGAKLEQFWDATLLRSPNRIANLMKLDTAGAFLETPSRSVVLDRKKQHLDICPDSQDAAKNADRVRKMGIFVVITILGSRLSMKSIGKVALAQRLDTFLSPGVVAVTTGLSLLVSFLAHKMHREYFFKYTEEYRRKDMSKIPMNIWKDV
jgi:phenylpropionate dioxygenase-like ring-hydroxylating dioxygenase large terminal subunit